MLEQPNHTIRTFFYNKGGLVDLERKYYQRYTIYYYTDQMFDVAIE